MDIPPKPMIPFHDPSSFSSPFHVNAHLRSLSHPHFLSHLFLLSAEVKTSLVLLCYYTIRKVVLLVPPFMSITHALLRCCCGWERRLLAGFLSPKINFR